MFPTDSHFLAGESSETFTVTTHAVAVDTDVLILVSILDVDIGGQNGFAVLTVTP